MIRSFLYVLKDYAEEGFFEKEKFAIPKFDAITNTWRFSWRSDMLNYYDPNNFHQLVSSYISLKNIIYYIKD